MKRVRVKKSDPSLFWRTATVMWNWRDVAHHREVEPNRLQRSHRRLATSTWSPHKDLHFFQSMTHRLTRCVLRDHLGCVGGALARALEPDLTSARPADHVPLQVGNRHNRVIKS